MNGEDAVLISEPSGATLSLGERDSAVILIHPQIAYLRSVLIAALTGAMIREGGIGLSLSPQSECSRFAQTYSYPILVAGCAAIGFLPDPSG